MSEPAARLPARLEVQLLLRAVAAAGGFGAVLHGGDADSGALLVVLADRGAPARLYERVPDVAGGRPWRLLAPAAAADLTHSAATTAYLDRRTKQDPDLWVVELDIADGERFILQSGSAG